MKVREYVSTQQMLVLNAKTARHYQLGVQRWWLTMEQLS